MSRATSNSPAASQPNLVDPLVDTFIDYSEYDNSHFHSPSLSPAGSKAAFVPVKPEPVATPLMPNSQTLSGPSHQYDLYKQQTGIVPGALASTLAINENNPQITGYTNYDYMSMTSSDELFDFNTVPGQGSMHPEMEMDFESPPAEHGFVFDSVNPSSIGRAEPSTSVGRVWPGMHQQAALKAQAQQRQQQQIIQQQQEQKKQQQAKQSQRPKGVQPTDPIVEQKISQLLSSMRAQSGSALQQDNSQLMQLPRAPKCEDDMDDDERLLASEEGKKLSSKERRQLRNKVSARAFRSRRKEYITQLEAEIATKVTENGDLRAQNRLLMEENKRLTDLSRMLLSSPSFSDFLNRLSSDPSTIPPPAPQQQLPEQQPSRQVPKDVNPYSAQQQIGMAMIPEQTMDFSMLTLDHADSFNYQPQVYAVLETPEVPVLDASILSGKASNFVGEHFGSDDEKIEMPMIEEHAAFHVAEEKPEVSASVTIVNEEFENDPAFALYHTSVAPTAPRSLDNASLSEQHIFGGIQTEKALARFELVDVAQTDAAAAYAMARVQHLSAGLESVKARLEMLTLDL